uniref:Uncharacterized protein n=1 Tax=Ralstonia solanacearum TaxID=305 RepID=A0A0S4VIN5_RALSL|nr:protein of unknown function [Ralstonia solanacearum]CUV42658.1 protein of unknown function [Ralstonia solanacearum]
MESTRKGTFVLSLCKVQGPVQAEAASGKGSPQEAAKQAAREVRDSSGRKKFRMTMLACPSLGSVHIFTRCPNAQANDANTR